MVEGKGLVPESPKKVYNVDDTPESNRLLRSLPRWTFMQFLCAAMAQTPSPNIYINIDINSSVPGVLLLNQYSIIL